MAEKVPASHNYRNRNPWNGRLWLLTPEEYEALPEGVVLTSINDNTVTKGGGYVDMDTRGGYLAYGLFQGQFDTEGRS